MERLSSATTESWLPWFWRGVLILLSLVLIGRLFELQIIKGNYYKGLAEGNRIRRVPIVAPRGKILARGGEILVGNKEVIEKIIFDPIEGYTKTTDTRGAKPEQLITEHHRDYKLGQAFAHAGGYLGEVSPDEVGKIDPRCPERGPWKIGQLVGRSGLEREYNCTLSGTDGEELVEVDAFGKEVRILGKKDPIPGNDLKTSISFSLQEKVAKALDKKGAVVATDGKGEVLAYFSFPSYDPTKVGAYLNDPNLPLFDRVVGGLFHPGSVFKPIVAMGALEERKIDKNYIFSDPGVIRVGTFSYSNWYFNQYGKTEGEIGLVRAIARSTDTFFYTIGAMIGPDKIAQWANKFGMGQPTGIDIPGEVADLIPTPEWKLKATKQQWFLGNTYHYAIGQGDVAVKPLSVNVETSVLSQDGTICLPRIAEKPVCKSLNIDKKKLDLVREGMIEACTTGGTGYTFFDFKPQVACKTGTAETAVDGEPHAWFTVYAPADFPTIVLTVMVERGGEGSKVAGPIATEIMKFWFSEK